MVAIAVKEMTPLRPRAIEVSAPIWTREQNQLLRSSTDGALLQVIYSQKKISSDTGYLFLENIGRWRPCTGYSFSEDIFSPKSNMLSSYVYSEKALKKIIFKNC